MNAWDYIKYYIKYFWLEEIYSILALIYLYNLDKLNKKLLSIGFDNPFKLVAYDNYAPAKFFLLVLILFGIGCCLVAKRFFSIIGEPLSLGEIISSIVAMGVILVFLIFLFVFINNPILRAIMGVCASIIGLAYIWGK